MKKEYDSPALSVILLDLDEPINSGLNNLSGYDVFSEELDGDN
jgi:hypothetical protein